MNPANTVCITDYTPGDREQWDAYCDAHYASYASYARWYDVLPRLGYRPLFLMAKDLRGQVVGILPAALSLLPGRRYGVSTWADGRMYAGSIANNAEVERSLLYTFEQVCRKNRLALIRIIPQPWGIEAERLNASLIALRYTPKDGNPSKQHYTFVLDLSRGFGHIWSQLDSADRSQYRKSVRDGLVVRQGRESFSLDMYYQMKRKVWQRLGNICPRKQEIYTIDASPQLDIQWWSAWYEEKLVGALYCYQTTSSYYLKGSVYDSDYTRLNINTRLYLDSIESACREGKLYYEFGSTPPPGSGHYEWKSKFGGKPYPIVWYEKVLSPLQVFLRKSLLRLTRPLIRRYSYNLTGQHDRLLEWCEE